MADRAKGYEIIRGEEKAEPERAEKILKKLLQDENLKLNPFYKEPGAVIDPHYHTENLAAYVLAGRVQIKIRKNQSEILEFLPGDAFLIKKGTIHCEEVISDVPCEMTGAYAKDFETVQVNLKH